VTLSAANFATAFRQWYKRCEKFADIARSYVEKKLKIYIPLPITVFFSLRSSGNYVKTLRM
jgi:hypothetical protein